MAEENPENVEQDECGYCKSPIEYHDISCDNCHRVTPKGETSFKELREENEKKGEVKAPDDESINSADNLEQIATYAKSSIVLKPKHLSFLNEYMKDKNGRQAAIRAGYAKESAGGTASRILQIQEVAEKLREMMAEAVEEVGIDQTTVIGILHEIAADIKQPGTVRISAAEKLGKHLGMWPQTPGALKLPDGSGELHLHKHDHRHLAASAELDELYGQLGTTIAETGRLAAVRIDTEDGAEAGQESQDGPGDVRPSQKAFGQDGSVLPDDVSTQ